MNVFVLAILFYLLYRFIVGFLIPLFRATRHMRQQFHDVNGNGNPGSGTQAGPGPGPSANTEAPKPGSSKVGEYIDFEEIH